MAVAADLHRNFLISDPAEGQDRPGDQAPVNRVLFFCVPIVPHPGTESKPQQTIFSSLPRKE